MKSPYSYKINNIDKSEWSNYLQDFDDASIYQTWSYGKIRWGNKNLSHLIFSVNGEVLGLAQAVIKKIPFLKAGIAYIPWGPLWQKKGKKPEYEIFRYMIRALKKEYVDKQKLFLRIKPNIIEEGHENVLSILKKEGLKHNTKVQPYRTFVLDLTKSLEEIRKGLKQKWRNQLNRAEKNDLTFKEGTSNQLYEAFLYLQKEMLTRKGFTSTIDYEEFGEIQNDLPGPLKMNILICEDDGEPVTATICSAMGNSGIYMLGANGGKGMNLKASYLFQWRMIQWLKEKGCTQYDLGGIDPGNNPGVYHFKAGMGGKDVYHIGQYELYENKLSFFIVRTGELLKNNVQRIKTLIREQLFK